MQRLDFDGNYRVEANDFIGAIWVLRNVTCWNVNIISSTSQLIHMEVSSYGGSSWFLMACYGRPQPSLRVVLWSDLRSLAPTLLGPWCVVGDFNVVMFDHEISRAANSHRSSHHFRDCV